NIFVLKILLTFMPHMFIKIYIFDCFKYLIL
ncbi:hypothetical protein, partial [Plasmodium yoelii yoelii]